MSWSMADPWWPQGRIERYRISILNQQEALIQTQLDGVSSGVIEWGVDNDIRAAGNLDLTLTDSNKSIDWAKVRMRIEYILKWDGVDKVYPLGVYIPSAPKSDVSPTDETLDLEFYDKTIILKQDKLANTKAFAKGSYITNALKWVFDSIGDDKYVIDASTKKFSKNRVYKAGTSKLEIVQALLKDLDYFAIWCDGDGYFRCHAYKLPKDRPVVYEFLEGDKSIHSARWQLDQDGFEVPNRVITIPRTGSKSGLAEDLTSRWGYAARGRWITAVESDVDETTTAKLNAKAKTLLAAKQDVHDKVTISHAFLPVNMNELVRFKSQGHAGTFAFRQMSISLTPTALVQSTLEGVTV